MKIAAAIAVLGLGAATAAIASPLSPSDHFNQAGYAVDVRHNGETMVLTGRNPDTKATFRISVDAANHVTGTWNGQPINYVMASGGSARLDTVAFAGEASLGQR